MMKAVMESGKMFLGLVDQLSGRQRPWVQTLLKSGVEPGTLSSSLRSLIEYDADRFLRAAISYDSFVGNVQDLEGKEEDSGDNLSTFLHDLLSLMSGKLLEGLGHLIWSTRPWAWSKDPSRNGWLS